MKNKELSKEEAIRIANIELKNSYYSSMLNRGWIYSLLNFELECKETIYNDEEVYYIRVIGGTFSGQSIDNHKTKNSGLLSRLKNIDGIFCEDSNIKCVIYKKTGKYEYLGD